MPYIYFWIKKLFVKINFFFLTIRSFKCLLFLIRYTFLEPLSALGFIITGKFSFLIKFLISEKFEIFLNLGETFSGFKLLYKDSFVPIF